MPYKPPFNKLRQPRPTLDETNKFISKAYRVDPDAPRDSPERKLARIQHYQKPLNYFGWFLGYYGGKAFRNLLSKEDQWALMVQGIQEGRQDWEGFFLEEFNDLITSHACLQGRYPGLNQEDVYQDARLETLTLVRKTQISDVKTLPGLLTQHLNWWFSNYCTRLNAQKAHLVALQDEHSQFTGRQRKAAAPAKDKHLPGARLCQQEKLLLLQKCVGELEAIEQTILRECFRNKLTETELAELLQYSQSQISRKKQAALQKLQAKLIQAGLTKEDWLEF